MWASLFHGERRRNHVLDLGGNVRELAAARHDRATHLRRAAEILTSESASAKSQIIVLEKIEMTTKSEVRDGMRVDWDVEIRMPDGVTLRCDIFRPLGEERVPALVTYGPYGNPRA
jgi:predicted acyl esterase